MRSRKDASVATVALVAFLAAANFGCGRNSGPLSVSLSPITATVQEGITQQFTATLSNDPAGKGVTWNVSCAATSPFCGGPGTLSATSSLSGVPITYTAPNIGNFNYPDEVVSLTATSVSNPSVSATATVKIPPPPVSVSILPAAGVTHVNGVLAFEATVQNDYTGTGITWNIQGCSGDASICGTFSGTGCSVPYVCGTGYLAPASVPPGGKVTVVATSIQDPTKSVSATAVVSPINFSSTAYVAGNAPESVVVADFNGDGKLDLAVADNGDPSTGDNGGVSILLGNGDGTFQPAQVFSAGNNPTFLSVGDFNGDGKMDLAVSDLGQLPSGGNGSLSILLGNGDGTFQTPIIVNAGMGPYAQALGDFNRDGKLDIAIIDFGNLSGNHGSVYVLLGKGDGTFQPALLVNAGDSSAAFPTAIVANDFNGDGKVDLAVTTSDSNLSVLLGNGDGTFQAPVFYPGGATPTSIAAGDLRNSGKVDLAISSFSCTPEWCGSLIQVLSGNGDGTFRSRQNVSLTYANGPPPGEMSCQWQGLQFKNGIQICFPLALQIADFDGSGRADLVGLGGVPLGGGLFVLPGNGDGTFEAVLGYRDPSFSGPWPVPGGSGAGLAIADFNGDGEPDIVSTWMGDPNVPPVVTVLLNETVPYGAPTHTKRKSNVNVRK